MWCVVNERNFNFEWTICLGICVIWRACIFPTHWFEICWSSDLSLVVGGRVSVQYLTSEFYFWQRVNVRVFWEILCCGWMLWYRMIKHKNLVKEQLHLVNASLICLRSQGGDINLFILKCECQVLISRYVLEHVASHLLYNKSSPACWWHLCEELVSTWLCTRQCMSQSARVMWQIWLWPHDTKQNNRRGCNVPQKELRDHCPRIYL